MPGSREMDCAALHAASREKVIELADRLAGALRPQPCALPRSGLQLLTLRDAVAHELFYLGEIPVVSAHVSLAAPDGAPAEGGAIVMDNDTDYAVALAILDGVLAHALPGREEARALVKEGEEALAARHAERAEILARTRVDFSLMSEAPDDDA